MTWLLLVILYGVPNQRPTTIAQNFANEKLCKAMAAAVEERMNHVTDENGKRVQVGSPPWAVAICGDQGESP